MSIVQMPDTYYPTPRALADEMVSGIDFDTMKTFLEPSAGTGSICKSLAQKYKRKRDYGRDDVEIDCIEIDPNVRSILRSTFGDGESRKLLKERERELLNKKRYDYARKREVGLTESEQVEYQNVIDELHRTSAIVRVVHDDFLTFRTSRRYDAIIMNPPFDHGDLHLLHALDLMKDGGYIVCLLNAETIRNPYTNSRKTLVQKLENYSAEIEYKTAAFMTSETERKTNVEVALIKVTIPRAERHSILFDLLQKAKEQEQADVDPHELTAAKGTIENLIEQYDTEIKLGVSLINEYRAICPYIKRVYNAEDSYGSSPILTLTVGTDENRLKTIDVNEFAKCVRKKYWSAYFANPEFTGMLTSNLKKDFKDTVKEMANYEFSAFNIQQVLAQMQAQLTRGVEETIMALFEKLTAEHTWYPECKQNIHYYNGWKTNKAHKVGKKCIIPENGFESSWYTNKKRNLDKYKCNEILSDLEKALNYLDCGETENYDLEHTIKVATDLGLTKVNCKYFNVVFYKKGTCHITFTCPSVIDKLNIFAGRRKGWLPPRYGKVRYDDMSDEEQSVIDDFSGKEAYEQVCNEPGRYIIETSSMLQLNA